MDLPALLPQKLHDVRSANSEQELLDRLINDPKDLIVFFEYACDDETWSRQHAEFMKLALHWLTNQFFEDQLFVDFAKKTVSSIHKHYTVLRSWIPDNITIEYGDHSVKANSLLWGTSSEFMRQQIRQECRDQHKKTLTFKDMPPVVFSQIEEFVNTGEVQNLWSKGQAEIVDVLHQAAEWHLSVLCQSCEEVLIKYITDGNVVDQLIIAFEEQWPYVRKACMERINRGNVGVKLRQVPLEHLSFEFVDFRDGALKIFERLRNHITHLLCGGSLPDQPEFSDVVNRCPKLICLDVSLSDAFTEKLLDIPENLQELGLGKCGWLSPKNLKKMIENCPQLTKIDFSSNIQLNYSSWGLLRNLKNLTKLDISLCHQVKDQDFKVILQACKNVTMFSLSGCTGLTDLAFFELAKHIPTLFVLDISRCHIYDGALIDLATKCPRLGSLNLSRCTTLSDKGIIEAVRNAPNLQYLNLTGSGISQSSIEKIRRLRPFLELA